MYSVRYYYLYRLKNRKSLTNSNTWIKLWICKGCCCLFSCHSKFKGDLNRKNKLEFSKGSSISFYLLNKAKKILVFLLFYTFCPRYHCVDFHLFSQQHFKMINTIFHRHFSFFLFYFFCSYIMYLNWRMHLSFSLLRSWWYECIFEDFTDIWR